MKSRKPIKQTNLTKKEIERGIFINAIQRVKELPVRKLKAPLAAEVAFSRKAIVFTQYGKKLAVLLPVAENWR